jgi:pimeloyl-ACP methyl ester carboxylesterase
MSTPGSDILRKMSALGRAKPSRARLSRRELAENDYQRLPPARAGDLAFRRFCTPKLSSRRTADHEILAARARFHLRHARWVTVPTIHGAVQAYIYEPENMSAAAPSVLIAHGWTSEASFMAVFAEQLRRAGFRVVAFDQPAHGKSPGARASLIDCARALLEVATQLGPIQSVVAHSMGCLASLLAGEGASPMAHAYPFERYVLVSSPNRFADITTQFSDELKLSAAAKRVYEGHLERIAHRRIRDFTAARMLEAIGRPALLLHARDDYEISFANSVEIAEACPNATLAPFDNQGHRNILFAPPVIRAAVTYLQRG